MREEKNENLIIIPRACVRLNAKVHEGSSAEKLNKHKDVYEIEKERECVSM